MDRFDAGLDFAGMAQQAQRAGHLQQPADWLQAALSAEELVLLAQASMRCGGCGSKVGATSLDRALRRLQAEETATDGADGDTAAAAGSGVVLGLEQPDDAAVLEAPPPGLVTVGSTGCLGGAAAACRGR